MCGIAAIFDYREGRAVERPELGRMLEYMKRRGPDGAGEWYGLEGAVGLGHRRLSIIDLSEAGAQPMVSGDGSLVVTFNGEIYNYQELRRELEGQGRRFRSHSDTEVLLHLYEVHGQEMVQRLRGMFAFAIWDGKRRGLFLARDGFGIKPVYYADDGRVLRVASQVKALLAGGGCDTSPEAAGHVGFFLWGHVPAPWTLYRGIRVLPAGTTLWVDSEGRRMEHLFCSITGMLLKAEKLKAEKLKSETREGGKTNAEKLKAEKLKSETENPDRLKNDTLSEALVDTVRQHLIADVPVGVFLSSGLDSTTLTALAAQCSATLRTVTLGFEEFRGSMNDETPLAEQVAARYGAKHQTIWVRKEDFRENFTRLLRAMDQPTCDGVNSFFISLAAAQAGLKVALSGLGGDELFGSYPSFVEVPRIVNALRPLRTIPNFGRAFRVMTAPLLKRMTSPKYAGLIEYGPHYGSAYLLRRGMFAPWELPDLLDADLVREGWERLEMLTRLEATVEGLESPHLRMAALEMTWYMRHQLLRDTDWASMEHSLEVRTPLVDVELLRRLGPLLAADRPLTKQDMARSLPATLAPLPDSILNRRKTGFSVPVRDWLRSDDRAAHTERGLRGWVRLVYEHQTRGTGRRWETVGRRWEMGDGRLKGKAEKLKTEKLTSGTGTVGRRWEMGDGRPEKTKAEKLKAERLTSGGENAERLTERLQTTDHGPRRVLALVADGFGGHGGIAKFNRDLLRSICSHPDCGEVVALPRLMPYEPGELPEKLTWVTGSLGGKFRYVKAVTHWARSLRRRWEMGDGRLQGKAEKLKAERLTFGGKNAEGLKADTRMEGGFDLIVCGHINLLPMAFLAKRLARRNGPGSAPPITLIVHGVDAWQRTPSPICNRLVREVDRFIAVSELTRERFVKWAGLSAEQGLILPNCVELSAFGPGPKAEELLERYHLKGRKVLMTLGRLASRERMKGFDEVLAVLPEIAREVPNVSYLIAGDGDDRSRLEANARMLGVSDRVVFAGFVPEAEKAAHYRLADAYVMPSRGEGFGIVFLEALACGVPVIGSKLDGSREALRGGELGTLVDPGNRAELREAILSVLRKGERGVPAGLEYFSFANYERRCWQGLGEMLKS